MQRVRRETGNSEKEAGPDRGGIRTGKTGGEARHTAGGEMQHMRDGCRGEPGLPFSEGCGSRPATSPLHFHPVAGRPGDVPEVRTGSAAGTPGKGLFADTPKGARASTGLYTLVESAKVNDLDVFGYLKYLLTEMPNNHHLEHPKVIDRYLPWSPELPEECRLKHKNTKCLKN